MNHTHKNKLDNGSVSLENKGQSPMVGVASNVSLGATQVGEWRLLKLEGMY